MITFVICSSTADFWAFSSLFFLFFLSSLHTLDAKEQTSSSSSSSSNFLSLSGSHNTTLSAIVSIEIEKKEERRKGQTEADRRSSILQHLIHAATHWFKCQTYFKMIFLAEREKMMCSPLMYVCLKSVTDNCTSYEILFMSNWTISMKK